jgi:adenylate kinase family enzyme
VAEPIDEMIADLEHLDRLRARARTLQQQAVKALTHEVYWPQPRPGAARIPGAPTPATGGTAPVGGSWPLPDDDVEKGMMLQALLKLNARKDGPSPNQIASRDNLLRDLSGITAMDCISTKEAGNGLDSVPIMRCAIVLQALVAAHYGLESATLACFHRIVTELNTVAGPTWSGGAARANTEAVACAFITGECARALLTFERSLLKTAEAAEFLAREMKRQDTGFALWQAEEDAFRNESFKASLMALQPNLLVDLTRVTLVAPNIVSTLNSALVTIPPADTILETLPAAAGATPTDPMACIVARDVDVAAASIARHVLEKFLTVIKAGLTPIAGAAPPNADHAERIALNLKAGAQIVHELVQPTGCFAEAIIDRELAAPLLNLSVDAAELVFAACLLGQVSGWHHPKVRTAFQHLRPLLSSDGRLLSLRPFNVHHQGYRANVTTLETTRRLAELAAHAETELQSEFVGRLMQPFEGTRALGNDDNTRGWTTDPPGREPRSEWWVTALAVDALGTVVDMINQEINRRVLQQFLVRWPDRDKLDLDRLFYPDYGLAKARQQRSIAVKLQDLRVHAARGSKAADPLFSLVIYGPPGTGKTTLVEALANTACVPLIEITPSDILVGGEEAIERRTRHVFAALSMLTHAVILFDEFDPILQSRAKRKEGESPQSIFEFLTPGMLPKLKQLHERAKENRASYVLATNFVYNLDRAVIRGGRFDDQHGIYPPDAVSRLGRLLDQLKRANVTLNHDQERRIPGAIRATAGGAMDQIGRPGWFSAGHGPLFNHIRGGDNLTEARQEARFKEDWNTFLEKRIMQTNERWSDFVARVQNPAEWTSIRSDMSEAERKYWDDWFVVSNLDAEPAAPVATLDSLKDALTAWAMARRPTEAPPPEPPPPSPAGAVT